MNVEENPPRVFLNRNTLSGALAAFLILLAVVALYAPGINAPLVFDDASIFDLSYASAYGASFEPLTPRFWSWATFAFQRILFGEDLTQFRAVNIALHLLSGVGLFLFLKTLFTICLGRDPHQGVASSRMPGIWLGVLLFLVHPVAVYGVAYLSQRSIVMATLFTLLMWWAHLRGLESGKPFWFLWSCLFCYFALFSKEHSVMAPVVTLMLTGFFPGQVWRRIPLLTAFLVYFGLAVLVAIQNKYAIATAYQPWLEQGLMTAKTGNLYLASILTQMTLFFKYLFLWLVPVTSSMSVDMSESLVEADSLRNWIPAALFIAYCGASLKLLLQKGKRGLLGFALLAPAALFMTELSTARVTESFVLYRSYLWAPPLFVVVPLLAERMDKRMLLITGLLAGSVLFLLSAERLQTFSSPIALWSDAIRLAEVRGYTTLRDRQYCNRGMAYMDQRQFELALDDFANARRWNPKQPVAYLGEGQALFRLGRLEQAKVSLDTALLLKPDLLEALMARAEISRKLGDMNAADADLRFACESGRSMFACYARKKMHGEQNIQVFNDRPSPPALTQ
jgi:hypothetical protein